MSTSNLSAYREEVEQGLPSEIGNLDRALERQSFYDYEGERYERRFRRDAESSFDFQGRSHRQSGFLRETIGKLCGHLYCPGPSRRWSEPAGDEFLQKVYRDNHVNSLLHRADCLSTLNDVVAIQIDAGEGDFDKKPLTYRLWAREQFCVWCDSDEPTVPIVVCTKDLYDGQVRYRLWNDEEVWTFLGKKLEPGAGGGWQTSGKVAVAKLEKKEPHEYKCLPFSFIHFEPPVQQFYGVAVGEFLMGAEVCIDNRLMKLDESIDKYQNPIPVAEGVDEQWKPNIEPGRWIRMPLANPRLDSGGNYQAGDYAKLYYVQAQIDVTGAWEDIRQYIDLALEAADIPKSAVRMEQMGTASGIALMVEQEPLLKRAENRRGAFCVYEEDLAQRSLRCAGNHYGKSELVTLADKGSILCAWPRPRLSINTPDQLSLVMEEEANKLRSRLMTIEDMYGVNRDEALEMLAQFEKDAKDMMAAAPLLMTPPAQDENSPEHPTGFENFAPQTNAPPGKGPEI